MRVKPNEAEALDAFARGRFDIEVFCREVLGIEPNRAQKRWFRLINPAEDGWQWRLKLVIHVAANQIGKTIGISVLILWACQYKIGVAPPPEGASDADYKDWISRPYNWFHLAPTQQQAYIRLDDLVLIIQGAHPAQDKGKELGLKVRWLPGLCQESKIEQYYRGLTFWNGSSCQFRTTEDKAKALQGRRAAGISFDEAAFEDLLKSVVNETLMMRLVAMGGPLFLIGTPIFQHLANEYAPQARNNGLAWDIRCDNIAADTDPVLLETILRNLISNAIRYTPHGSIQLRCAAQHSEVVIDIQDTGIGISATQQQEVFNEFVQLQNPERDRNKGLGLGLAIVKRLSHLLQHELTLHSEPGIGTTFSLRLPLATLVPAMQAKPEFPQDGGNGLQVLVIDDEAVVLKAIQLLLTEWGYAVTVAESAQAALKCLNSTPDIIIADYRLRENLTGIDAIAPYKHIGASRFRH